MASASRCYIDPPNDEIRLLRFLPSLEEPEPHVIFFLIYVARVSVHSRCRLAHPAVLDVPDGRVRKGRRRGDSIAWISGGWIEGKAGREEAAQEGEAWFFEDREGAVEGGLQERSGSIVYVVCPLFGQGRLISISVEHATSAWCRDKVLSGHELSQVYVCTSLRTNRAYEILGTSTP